MFPLACCQLGQPGAAAGYSDGMENSQSLLLSVGSKSIAHSLGRFESTGRHVWLMPIDAQ